MTSRSINWAKPDGRSEPGRQRAGTRGGFERRPELTGQLTRSGGPDLGLVVGQQFGIGLYQFFPDDILSDGIGELDEPQSRRMINTAVLVLVYASRNSTVPLLLTSTK